jgi:hypothetical protein
MKIFISWSKEPSKQVAEALAEWLPDVIQSLKPWVSREIPAGSRWNSEIANELSSTKFGIICVTKVNQHEPWLQFEAGALAKTLDEQTRVCPYLIDMSEGELNGPLVAFQSVRADEVGTRKLVHDIHSAIATKGEAYLTEAQLNKAFDRNWKDLQTKLNALVDKSKTPSIKAASIEEMVTEILTISRETNRQLNAANDDSDSIHTGKVNSVRTGKVKRTIELGEGNVSERRNSFSVEGNSEKVITFKETLESLNLPSTRLRFKFDGGTHLVCYTWSNSSSNSNHTERVAKEIANLLDIEFLPF